MILRCTTDCLVSRGASRPPTQGGCWPAGGVAGGGVKAGVHVAASTLDALSALVGCSTPSAQTVCMHTCMRGVVVGTEWHLWPAGLAACTRHARADQWAEIHQSADVHNNLPFRQATCPARHSRHARPSPGDPLRFYVYSTLPWWPGWQPSSCELSLSVMSTCTGCSATTAGRQQRRHASKPASKHQVSLPGRPGPAGRGMHASLWLRLLQLGPAPSSREVGSCSRQYRQHSVAVTTGVRGSLAVVVAAAPTRQGGMAS